MIPVSESPTTDTSPEGHLIPPGPLRIQIALFHDTPQVLYTALSRSLGAISDKPGVADHFDGNGYIYLFTYFIYLFFYLFIPLSILYISFPLPFPLSFLLFCFFVFLSLSLAIPGPSNLHSLYFNQQNLFYMYFI